jgi:hypothetical protein
VVFQGNLVIFVCTVTVIQYTPNYPVSKNLEFSSDGQNIQEKKFVIFCKIVD